MTMSAEFAEISKAGKRAIAGATKSLEHSIASLPFQNRLRKRGHDLRRCVIGINSQQSRQSKVHVLQDGPSEEGTDDGSEDQSFDESQTDS